VIFLGLTKKLAVSLIIFAMSVGGVPDQCGSTEPIDDGCIEIVEEEQVEEVEEIQEIEEELSFIKPVDGGVISAYYGNRYGKLHAGIDIALSTGSRIYASEKGEVVYSGWSGSYGYLVKVKHKDGYETYYAHCSRLLVSVGDMVEKGQDLACVGSTGNATGPHIHFEIRLNGTSLNPYEYIY
jgi:murein DD-endopeptidase MepM/ murein hydrolase activator NlpD